MRWSIISSPFLIALIAALVICTDHLTDDRIVTYSEFQTNSLPNYYNSPISKTRDQWAAASPYRLLRKQHQSYTEIRISPAPQTSSLDALPITLANLQIYNPAGLTYSQLREPVFNEKIFFQSHKHFGTNTNPADQQITFSLADLFTPNMEANSLTLPVTLNNQNFNLIIQLAPANPKPLPGLLSQAPPNTWLHLSITAKLSPSS